MTRILVSGAGSGLGKYLREYFQASALNRRDALPHGEYDAIIHCAFNAGRNIPASAFAQYLDDNLGLTEKLLAVPHRAFVFISSVDVYPPDGTPHAEEEDMIADAGQSLYGVMKLAAEARVRAGASLPLILRPTAMLGPYIRKNSLLKLLEEDNPALTLAADSSFNYVLHEDIARLIALCLKEQREGAYNIASAANVTLADICAAFSRRAQFGNYCYDAGTIDSRKAAALLPAFTETSLKTIERFVAAREKAAA